MCQLDRLYSLKSQINEIAKRHNAEKVYVFGSCARKEETSESDIDLLIEFKADSTLYDQIDLRDEMSAFLQGKVDVVSKKGLHPFIRKSVLEEAVAL